MEDPAVADSVHAPIQVLLVDGDPAVPAPGIETGGTPLRVARAASSWTELAEAAEAGDYELAVIDARLSWADPGDLLRMLKAARSDLPVIMFAADGAGEAAAAEAMQYGLDGYVTPQSERQLPVMAIACLARAAQRGVRRALDQRERDEAALRRSEAQARFLVRLSDATRPLEHPEEIADVTMQLLREALSADRCTYAEVEPGGEHFSFTAVACASGVPSVAGRFRTSAFGGDTGGEGFRRAMAIEDAQASPPPGAEPDLYQALGIGALLVVPIVKSERMTACAGVHMLGPRRWTADEVELVSLAAERLWEAMERARVSNALRESEAEFRALFELSAVGVAQTDPVTGRFLRVNSRFCELTGYSEGELREKTYSGITHPDDRERNAAAIEPVLRGEVRRWDIEKRYIRADGGVAWVQISGQMVPGTDGRPLRVIANAVDVTARKRAEEALLASRRQLQAVTDDAPVLLANCGLDYRFKFVNRAYAERFGLEPADLPGRSVADVLGRDAFAQLKPHADRALKGRRSEFEAEVDYRDLGKQWIRCAYAPEWDETGRVVGWVAAILDITDRKRAEQALREADRRKDEFLAVLGHELRNPLAPLRSGVDLLRAAAEKPELMETVRSMMERQLGHLIHLVDDLLDLSRVSRGEVGLRRARLDLNAVVEAALELSRPAIEQHRHELLVHQADEPLSVDGDLERLTQVVGNLLSNAAKYTPPEGTIRVRTEADGGCALVRVSDTGFGIPPEKLGSVFEMFSQVPEHRVHTGGGGLGIGLALSKQLVTLHGGSIDAHSEGLGWGAEFVVRLPLADTDEQGQLRPRTPAAAETARRVLVVDDNADAAESLKLMLELKGHSVFAAHDGQAALSALESFAPEIVLLDIGLPEMDGYEVARRIRAAPGGGDVRLFAVTGWGQEADKRRARDAGFDGHLTKPVDAATLTALIGAGSQ